MIEFALSVSDFWSMFSAMELAEPDCLTEAELKFRLKGNTRVGKRWNEHYAQEVAEYHSGIAENDPGFAASKAADVRKRYNGMQQKLQNLAKSTEGQREDGLNP